MKIILLKDVPKVGRKHEVREVADGFAYNSLLPRGLAVRATPDALKRAERAETERAEEVVRAEALCASLTRETKEQPLVLARDANEKGHLFQGVRAGDIVRELASRGITLPESCLSVQTPIKETGPHVIPLRSGNARGELSIVINKN
jgi:large subunit ribosomal protein L9